MDRTLVERAMRGDEGAYASLASTAGDRLLSIAYRVLRDLDQAEDAVQVALVGAWRDLPTLREPDHFDAWLTRLLIRACYGEARRQRRWSANIRAMTNDGATSPDMALAVADRDQLERGFRRLPADQRAVFVLHHYVGWTLVEIAETLEIPLGTAKSRLHYATQTLRAALDADARIVTPVERLA